MAAPKLRFKEFVNEICYKELGSLITLMQSGLSRQLKDEDIGLPVLRSNNIQDFRVDYQDIKYWYKNDPQGADTNNYLLKHNDLLVNFINSMAQIGKSAIYNGELGRDAIITTNLMRLQFNNLVIPKFISYYFQTKQYEDYIQSITKPAVNQASFTTKEFQKLKVPYFSIEEQTKVASFLSAVDEKISQLTQKHSLLSQYKQGMMQKLFSQQIRFKADDGSEFGEWEGKELHQIFQIKAGGDIEKSSVSEVRTSEFSYPIFANSDKNKGFYGWANKFKYKEAVTVTGRGNLGIAVARNEPFYPIVRLLVLLPLVKQNLKFFEEQINLLDIVSESTGVPQLTAPQLSKYKVNVPSLEEQTKIANFLSSIDQKIEVVAQQIEQAKQWKKGLLQQMFI